MQKMPLRVVVGAIQNRYERVSVNPDVENALCSGSAIFLIYDAVHHRLT